MYYVTIILTCSYCTFTHTQIYSIANTHVVLSTNACQFQNGIFHSESAIKIISNLNCQASKSFRFCHFYNFHNQFYLSCPNFKVTNIKIGVCCQFELRIETSDSSYCVVRHTLR